MSKATITYDLSDPEDREEFARATKASDMASCLFQVQNELRAYRKRANFPDCSLECDNVIDNISDRINHIYDDFDIDLDKLIT